MGEAAAGDQADGETHKTAQKDCLGEFSQCVQNRKIPPCRDFFLSFLLFCKGSKLDNGLYRIARKMQLSYKDLNKNETFETVFGFHDKPDHHSKALSLGSVKRASSCLQQTENKPVTSSPGVIKQIQACAA
jgi:hypothetical protein